MTDMATTPDDDLAIKALVFVEKAVVDPDTLVDDGQNLRDSDEEVLDTLQQSILNYGVREALRVVRDDEGRLIVDSGYTRRRVAIQGKAEGRTCCATVPVEIYTDPETDPELKRRNKIIRILNDAEPRKDLTEAQKVQATQQLMLFGLSIEQIATVRSVSRDRVKGAAKIMRSDKAMEELTKGTLNFVEAGALTEFEGDEEATERLTTAIEDGRFDNVLTQLRNERRFKELHAQKTAELVEQGIKVVEQPFYSREDDPMQALRSLRLSPTSKPGTRLEDEAHRNCPGRTVYIVEPRRTWKDISEIELAEVCVDFVAHGHALRWAPEGEATKSSTTGERKEETQAKAAEARKYNPLMRKGNDRRLKFLKDTLLKSTTPPVGADVLLWAVATYGKYCLDRGANSSHRDTIELLGLKNAAAASKERADTFLWQHGQDAPPGRQRVLQVGVAIGGIEKAMPGDVWRNADSIMQLYFEMLIQWGYKATPIEKYIANGLTGELSELGED